MKNKRIMSHIWKSPVTQCHTWTSSTSWHTNDWFMSLQMSHVTYMKDSYYTHERPARHDTPMIKLYSCALEFINHVKHTIESCQAQEWTLWYTYDWVMSLQMSHVTRVKESYYTHERAARHDTPMIECARWNKSCHTYEWVMSNTRMSTTSRHTSDWVMSLKTSHVTHTKESYHTR